MCKFLAPALHYSSPYVALTASDMHSLELATEAYIMTTAISPGVYMQPRGKEILCLCYDSNMLQVRRMLLEHFGYMVVSTTSADDVKDVIKEHCPDMLLMDNNDTSIDFEELAEQVKEICPDVITVMLSPYYYGSRGGATDSIDRIVAKDDGPDALLAHLEELLGPGLQERSAARKRVSRPV
jgi:CheY-like chemotaxis protein